MGLLLIINYHPIIVPLLIRRMSKARDRDFQWNEKVWESVRKCEKVWESVRKCEKVWESGYTSNWWFNPPEKYESQIGSSSQLLGKIKFMFQTTNQTWINDDIFGLDNDYNNIRLATAWRKVRITFGLPIIQSRGRGNISWYGHVMEYMICLFINETWGYHQNIMGLNQASGGCSANMMGYVSQISPSVSPNMAGPKQGCGGIPKVNAGL